MTDTPAETPRPQVDPPPRVPSTPNPTKTEKKGEEPPSEKRND